METSDLKDYFADLDKKLARLSSRSEEQFINENFPRYKHIGKYVDPRDEGVREFFYSELSDNLDNFSFDPLLSFPMNQVKYSKEILHPDCRCFRRSRSKVRPIKTCSHRDRILYSSWNRYLSLLHKKWLTKPKHNISDSVSAYIPDTGKFNAHYAKIAFDYIQGRKEYSAIALDVKSFFDKIPHTPLKRNLISLLSEYDLLSPDGCLCQVDFRMYKAVTQYTYIELDKLMAVRPRLKAGKGMLFNRHSSNWNRLRELSLIHNNSNFGIPQGLACSGTLANIAMMEFDLSMSETAKENDSIYIRYADDIFIASPNVGIVNDLYSKCCNQLEILDLPIAEEKTERFDYKINSKRHPVISYLGLECCGNEVSVRKNGVNKYYDRAYRYIFSYVLTCRRRGIKPSRKKIRAIFSHSGHNNYYAYLRRTYKVFENDKRYKPGGIKGVLKNHINWIDKTFDKAINARLPESKMKYVGDNKCKCPLRRDG